jgi:tetratricopeptide (TPR) repeat protein
MNKMGLLFIAILLASQVPAIAAKPLSDAAILKHYVDFGEFKKARLLCAEILKKNPNDADALVSRARISLSTGNDQSAMSDLNRALAIRKNFPLAIFFKAATYSDISKIQEVKENSNSYLALTNKASDLETQYRRAVIYSVIKDYKRSEQELKKILTKTASTSKIFASPSQIKCFTDLLKEDLVNSQMDSPPLPS